MRNERSGPVGRAALIDGILNFMLGFSIFGIFLGAGVNGYK
jgi:hypothetical protein